MYTLVNSRYIQLTVTKQYKQTDSRVYLVLLGKKLQS